VDPALVILDQALDAGHDVTAMVRNSALLPGYQGLRRAGTTDTAALDYATEPTRDKKVEPATFARLARYYNEREICDIVWLAASEHLNNHRRRRPATADDHQHRPIIPTGQVTLLLQPFQRLPAARPGRSGASARRTTSG
jgi:hypothetical protein